MNPSVATNRSQCWLLSSPREDGSCCAGTTGVSMRPAATISPPMPTSSVAAFVCGYVLLCVIAFSLSAPSSSPLSKTEACKKSGFLGLSCTGTRCVRKGGKCVVSDPMPAAAAAPSAARADALMRRRSVSNCLEAADIYEAAAIVGGPAGAALKLQAGSALKCACWPRTIATRTQTAII